MFRVIEKQYGKDEADKPQPITSLIDYIHSQGEGASGIVYCLAREESEQVAG